MYSFEHFDGATLPSPWLPITAANGTLAFADSNLVGQLSALGDAAAIFRPFDPTVSGIYQVCSRSPSGAPVAKMQLVRSATPPAAGPRASHTSKQLIQLTSYLTGGLRYLRMLYRDAAGVTQYWKDNTAVWSPSASSVSMPNPTPLDDYAIAGFEFDAVDTRIRMFGIHTAKGTALLSDFGPRLVGLTEWVSLGQLLNGAGTDPLWLLVGWPETDFFGANRFEIEWYGDSQGSKLFSHANQRANSAGKYEIAGHGGYDYRSLHWLPHGRGLRAVTNGTAGSVHWGSWMLDDADGMYKMSYSDAAGSSLPSISLARATHPHGPWTKHAGNPIIQAGAHPDYQQFSSNTLIKDPFEPDPNRRYKILASGRGTIFQCLLFTAPADAGPYAYEGVFLGPSGDEQGINLRGHPLRINNEWVFHYNCNVNNVGTVRRATCATIDVGAVVRQGVNLFDDGDDSAEATVTAVSGRVLTLSSNAGFVRDALVLFDNDPNVDRYGYSRIRAILSGNQIELYHSIPGVAPGGILRTVNRGISAALQQVIPWDGEFIWVTTTFKVLPGQALFESTAVFRSATLDDRPRIDWLATPKAMLGRLAWGNRQSTENDRTLGPIPPLP